MSEDDKESTKRQVKKLIDDFNEQAEPAIEAMAAAALENAKQVAADMGEPYVGENARFFATIGNLTKPKGGYLDSGSPELHALYDLAKTVTPRVRNEWRDAKRVTDQMFEELDEGEKLGRSGLLYHDFDKPADRAKALVKCAMFYQVPPHFAPALGTVVVAIMRHQGRRSCTARFTAV